MNTIIDCPRCGRKKDKIEKNGSLRCSTCRKEQSKARRAIIRAEKGLYPIGLGGRSPHCYQCGDLKENPKIGYCHACKRKQDNEWRLRTGRTKEHRIGKCRCGNEFASFSGYQCVDCYRKTRQDKKQDPNYQIQVLKESVRGLTRNYIKMGILTKGQCEVCGINENIEAHHDDYTKPLEIRWLCRKHHREFHKNRN